MSQIASYTYSIHGLGIPELVIDLIHLIAKTHQTHKLP